MESPNLPQAIENLISTSHEVRRLLEMIEDLPLRYEEKLLSYEDDIIKDRLTSRDIETLKYKLTHGSLVTDIDNGILGEPEDDDVTISNRLKYTRRKTKDYLFQIEDPKDVYGLPDCYSSRWYLAKIMDDAEAYDYINTVFIICREWNLVVDCLLNALSEREDEVNPQPQLTPTFPTSSSKELNRLLSDEDIKAVFDEVESIGLMEKRGVEYFWLSENPLLSYLCNRISQYKELSKKRRGDDYLPNWKEFNGIFKTKGKNGEWIDVDNNKLGEYQKQYKKNHGGSFNPDGCKQIDDIVTNYLL